MQNFLFHLQPQVPNCSNIGVFRASQSRGRRLTFSSVSPAANELCNPSHVNYGKHKLSVYSLLTSNLPPEMCMTKPYMFLSCVVPYPSNPTVGIDVYLQPLINDLKKLWSGVLTYDISRKQNFMMKAALMWTINDFRAYGMLSG